MGSVFDGQTKIGRRVPDPITDKNLSGPGALIFGAMTTPVGLAGCIGIDAKLIHGDRWQQIDSNMTEIIGVNESTTVGSNELHMVGGNRTTSIGANDTLTVCGNLTETVLGTSVYLHVGTELKTDIGPTIHNFISPLTENHCSPRNINEPTNTMELFGVKFQVQTTSNQMIGSQCQLIGNNVQYSLLSTGGALVQSCLYGATMQLFGFESAIGVAKCDAVAVDLNPGVEANGDSPVA
jgi:hypothetical protein